MARPLYNTIFSLYDQGESLKNIRDKFITQGWKASRIDKHIKQVLKKLDEDIITALSKQNISLEELKTQAVDPRSYGSNQATVERRIKELTQNNNVETKVPKEKVEELKNFVAEQNKSDEEKKQEAEKKLVEESIQNIDGNTTKDARDDIKIEADKYSLTKDFEDKVTEVTNNLTGLINGLDYKSDKSDISTLQTQTKNYDLETQYDKKLDTIKKDIKDKIKVEDNIDSTWTSIKLIDSLDFDITTKESILYEDAKFAGANTPLATQIIKTSILAKEGGTVIDDNYVEVEKTISSPPIKEELKDKNGNVLVDDEGNTLYSITQETKFKMDDLLSHQVFVGANDEDTPNLEFFGATSKYATQTLIDLYNKCITEDYSINQEACSIPNIITSNSNLHIEDSPVKTSGNIPKDNDNHV